MTTSTSDANRTGDSLDNVPKLTETGFIGILTVLVMIWGAFIAQRQSAVSDTQSQLLLRQTELMRQQLQISEAAPIVQRLGELQSLLRGLNDGDTLQGQAAVEMIEWSQAASPYSTDVPTKRAISKERGRLLISLVNCRANTSEVISKGNFANADLRSARFQVSQVKVVDVYLESAFLDKAVLSHADLTRAVLANASLNGTFLDHADLTRADLKGADLRNADLRHAILFKAEMQTARLEDARVDRADWLEFITSDEIGAVVDKATWIVEKHTQSETFVVKRRK